MIVFSGAALDRAAALRRRPEWVEARRADPRARAVLMSDEGVVLEDGHLVMERPGAEAVLLGLRGDTPLFADHVGAAEPERGHAAGLREAATELPAEEAALAAYAGSLLAWHRRHRFCANCGAPTESRDGGHERVCPSCGAHHFPRTDPVVIVRVTDGGGRTAARTPGALAGGPLLPARRLRGAGRDARGGGAARGARGVWGPARLGGLPRLAAVAVPQLADAGLQRARRARRPAAGRRRARRGALVRARGGRTGRARRGPGSCSPRRTRSRGA